MPATNRKTSLHRRLRLVAVVALLVAGAGAAWYYADRYMPYWHFRTVTKGVFYRSSQLNEEDLGEAIDDYGIKTVFNLRDVLERDQGDWYQMELRVAAAHGARVVDIPLMAGTPPNAEQIEKMLAVMDDPKNLPVLAHCYHGSIRSAAAEGLYRREYLDETGEEAFDRVESWGRDLAVDYPKIAKFILEYVPRRERK